MAATPLSGQIPPHGRHRVRRTRPEPPLGAPSGSKSRRRLYARRTLAMELGFSDEEEAFRAEVREWLARNVPDPPLPSGDTRDGFAAHLEWERTLFDARYAVVSWPRELGGRD